MKKTITIGIVALALIPFLAGASQKVLKTVNIDIKSVSTITFGSNAIIVNGLQPDYVRKQPVEIKGSDDCHFIIPRNPKLEPLLGDCMSLFKGLNVSRKDHQNPSSIVRFQATGNFDFSTCTLEVQSIDYCEIRDSLAKGY